MKPFLKNAIDKYRNSLDRPSKARYDAKIGVINDRDPYTLSKEERSEDMKLWASVTYFDIVNYLLYSCSAYTMDQLKCYKSLEAYNQFVNEWVRDVGVTKINGLCVHTAKVMHSQRLNDPPLSPWIIIHPEGRVISAHCNCMAGLGEACTHISALRFSIEASVKVRDSKTPTDEKAYWPPTSIKRVQCAPVGSIDFSSAKKKKKVLDCQLVDSPCKERGALELKEVRPPSEEKIQAFLEKLNATGVKSAILAVKPPSTIFQQANLLPQFMSDITFLRPHCLQIKTHVWS